MLKMIGKNYNPIVSVLWNFQHMVNCYYVYMCVYIFPFSEAYVIQSLKMELNDEIWK